MPGVFTSRGCTACRKQKKGCIATNDIPPCQRCKKLKIPCIGLGQRRFKFQDDSEKVIAIHGGKRVSQSKSKHVQDNEVSKHLVEASKTAGNRNSNEHYSFYTPTSALTRLTAAYVRGIDPVADISVHLPWNFGPFLEDVPRLLGASESLDAAADAVITGYGCLRMHRRAAEDQLSLRKYSAALKALAQALAEPVTATATETLCAIKMLMIFEAISGSSTSILSHAGGAARIFKARNFHGPTNDLEAKLLLSLRGPVVIQSLFLTHSYFTSDEWAAITESDFGAASSEEQSFRCLALYARLLQRTRGLFERRSMGERVGDEDLVALAMETKGLREMHEVFLSELRERFWGLDGVVRGSGEGEGEGEGGAGGRSMDSVVMFLAVENGDRSGDWGTNVLHAHIGRSYGLGLGCQILVNALLVALWDEVLGGKEEASTPAQAGQLDRRTLELENTRMAREVCYFAPSVSRHRPLGTVYMPFVLRVAYVGAEKRGADDFMDDAAICSEQDPFHLVKSWVDIEAQIRNLLRAYTSDFEGLRALQNDPAGDARLVGELAWLRDLFKLRLKEPTFVEKEG